MKDACEVAVHAQPAVAVTSNAISPPAAEMFNGLGAAYWHGAACVMVMSWPATLAVPARVPVPGSAVIENRAVPRTSARRESTT
jgi:hypothetical protein